MLTKHITRSLISRITKSIIDFDPNSLANCELWLDASDDSTVIDTTTPGQVEQWNDKSDNAYTIAQGTGTKQPITGVTTKNSKNVLDFDGTDTLPLPSGLYSIPNGDNTVFMVSKQDVINTNDRLINMEDTGSSKYSLEYTSAGGIKYHNSATGLGVEIAITETNWNTFTGSLTSATQSISVNSGSAITNANGVTTATIDAAAIGSNGSGTGQLLTGSIAEIVMYSRALSAAEILQVETYLSNKWNITI